MMKLKKSVIINKLNGYKIEQFIKSSLIDRLMFLWYRIKK